MGERRRFDPLPRQRRASPYSKGLMARALTAVGLREDEAYELARRTESDLATRGEVSVDLDRLRELAIEVLGEPRRGARDGTAAPALPRPPGARPAGDPARRRRHRHRQVDRRHRGRLPARDHARDVDRLRPPDDARLLREGVHALDPLLELRGRPRPVEGRGGGVGRRGAARLPRPDPQRAHRRRGRDAAGARRGLVDGARGRPPRARDDHDRAQGRARRPVRARDPRRGDPQDDTSGSATSRPRGSGLSTATSPGCPRSG